LIDLNNILFLKLVDKKNTKLNQENEKKLKNNLVDAKKNELFSLYSRSHLSKLKNTALIE
jgi:hypothetical protein